MNNTASALFLFLACLLACTPNTPKFTHDFEEGPTPWTSQIFNDDVQFRFAIFSDLTGGERERIFDVAVEQLNLLQPEMVLCVGDLIEGGTEDESQLEKEWNSFDERVSKIDAPVFRVGGNHDLSNPVMKEFWVNRYGNPYYHFVYKNVLFLVLNSEDLDRERHAEISEARKVALKLLDEGKQDEFQNSVYMNMEEPRRGKLGEEQIKYFEDAISKNSKVDWVFLFMHKPVWQREDSWGLQRIESALENMRYTVFNGHEHTYNYSEKNGRDYIKLGTTGGFQNPDKKMAFDHVTMITMKKKGPVIANLKMEGILNKEAKIPASGDTLNFQASQPRQ